MVMYAIATVLAAFTKGLCGFANAIVFSGVMNFSENSVNITPVELLLDIPGNVIMTVKNRKWIHIRNCLMLLLLILTGDLLGIFILTSYRADILKLFFSLFVIILGLRMLLQEIHPTNEKSWVGKRYFTAVLSGILCGLYGIGVLLAAHLQREYRNPDEFKGNFSFIFLIENVIRLVAYCYLGIITLSTAKKVIFLYPLSLTGLLCGIQIGERISRDTARKVLLCALIIAGFILLMTTMADWSIILKTISEKV